MSENHHEVEDTMLRNEADYMLKRLKGMHETFIKMSKGKSEYQYMRFTALKKSGFTEPQAIELLKHESTPYDINK